MLAPGDDGPELHLVHTQQGRRHLLAGTVRRSIGYMAEPISFEDPQEVDEGGPERKNRSPRGDRPEFCPGPAPQSSELGRNREPPLPGRPQSSSVASEATAAPRIVRNRAL